MNLQLAAIDDRCQNIVLNLLGNDDHNHRPESNRRRLDKAYNDDGNGGEKCAYIRNEIEKKETTTSKSEYGRPMIKNPIYINTLRIKFRITLPIIKLLSA